MHPIDYITGAYIKTTLQKLEEQFESMSLKQSTILMTSYILLGFLIVSIGVFLLVLAVRLALMIG